MALTQLRQDQYNKPNSSDRCVGADYDGVHVWLAWVDYGVSYIVLTFAKYNLGVADAVETVVFDSRVQFPSTDTTIATHGIRRSAISEFSDFCKTPTGFALVFTTATGGNSPGVVDEAGNPRRVAVNDDMWQFTYSGAVATRASAWQIAVLNPTRVGEIGETIVGVDFVGGQWYFLSHHSGAAGFTQDTLDIEVHAEPLPPNVSSAQFSEIAIISGSGFIDGRLLTRGPDGYYVFNITAGNFRFYDLNGAFVETQSASGSDTGGVSYVAGSLFSVERGLNRSFAYGRVYGALPVLATPPGKITEIEAFPGDGQVTYRITPPVSSLPVTGYQISADGVTGWSVITLDSNNEYVLTQLQNAVEITRYFRASSDAGNGVASNSVSATPSATAPVVPEPVDPINPGVTPDISGLTGQVYGAHEYRGRFDIASPPGSDFEILHRNVEMIWYTTNAQIVDLAVLEFSLETVFFIPVRQLNPSPPDSSYLFETTTTPLTQQPSISERALWSIQGVRRVGRDRRQLIVTEKN